MAKRLDSHLKQEAIMRESELAFPKEFPPKDSAWFNNNRKEIFVVLGVVRECEDANYEVLYKPLHHSAEETGIHFRRSLEEFLGNNRHGQPRFVRLPNQDIDPLNHVR